jgi:hypothetical protein
MDKLPPTEFAVMLRLAEHVNFKRWVATRQAIVWPSVSRIAKKVNCHARTVERALARLQNTYKTLDRELPKQPGRRGGAKTAVRYVLLLGEAPAICQESTGNLSEAPAICQESTGNLSDELREGKKRNEIEGRGTSAAVAAPPPPLKTGGGWKPNKLTALQRADHAAEVFRRKQVAS